MLSHTAQYALRGVLHIAAGPAEGATRAAETAAALDVPEKYLAQVLNTLAHAGVLRSRRGPKGGFRLARAAADLSLAQIVAPFDAVGNAPRCLIREQPCGSGEPCIAHEEWHAVAESVRGFFQHTTVADLLAGQALEDAAPVPHPSGNEAT